MSKTAIQSGIEVLRMSEALDAEGMVLVKNRMNRMMSRNQKRVVLDMTNTASVDLAGLGILVERIRVLRSAKGDIKFCNIKSEVNETLQLVGLNGLIESYPTREAAVASF